VDVIVRDVAFGTLQGESAGALEVYLGADFELHLEGERLTTLVLDLIDFALRDGVEPLRFERFAVRLLDGPIDRFLIDGRAELALHEARREFSFTETREAGVASE